MWEMKRRGFLGLLCASPLLGITKKRNIVDMMKERAQVGDIYSNMPGYGLRRLDQSIDGAVFLDTDTNR